ncbi:coiled-coil domain-containing protein 9B isoform X2 [Dunckerocampus dactyliophorus]|nr:coiled-coil domain-containing protein 9B isoform X2 [Dunckerocampus dactyliophorus]XP_054652462.1 coiled-coil domain-containing protein 9B isoform X2 [Dunckerocampus dactyliophorus]XP_054652463.1 coiled-coil domain-containing protein 9B isoform X2 [Dunckerocampus dactyliophorus]
MAKRDQERDLELDKKIEALRRKNEALMKRYKEVEEDKKRAEEEGMALQNRKGNDLTITINKSTCDSRVVVTKSFNSGSPNGKGHQNLGAAEEIVLQASGSAGRGHKKQLTVTMAGKKGKRVVSEKSEKRPDQPSDVKNPTDEVPTESVEAAGRGKQPRHLTKRDITAQELESHEAITDLNIPTSQEEQEEYLRWKKEREQIDKERVARHKNAKGQWRRAWDMDKTDNMFSDKSLPGRDWGPPSRGGRNARRGQHRSGADTRGHEKRGKDKATKNVQVMSSNAKGKDRLTGRARRWQDNEEGDHLQTSDIQLEEFLEELDALTDAEAEEQKDQHSQGSTGSSATLRADTPFQEKAEASSPLASEKKVRFSEELIQGAHTKQITGSQNSANSQSSPSSLKASWQKKIKREVPRQRLECAKEDEGSHGQQQVSESECTKKDINNPAAPCCPPANKPCAALLETSVQPAELAKCNTNTEELIDSHVCVLSLESGEAHPAHSSSSDKARENGKIV